MLEGNAGAESDQGRPVEKVIAEQLLRALLGKLRGKLVFSRMCCWKQKDQAKRMKLFSRAANGKTAKTWSACGGCGKEYQFDSISLS